MQYDRDYLLRRERECREAAERATDPGIKKTHLEFAERYAQEAANPPPDNKPRLHVSPDA